jgi:peptidase M28-like protein
VPSLDRTLQEVLALSREAGTADGARARELVATHLTGLGYRVQTQSFTFHPSSLLGFPIFGAGLGGLSLLLLPLLALGTMPAWGALLVWVPGLGSLLILSFSVGAGWLPLGGALREDSNLIAVRGEGPVRRWLVAHLDTKAQVQSMAGRLVAVWIIAVAVVTLTLMCLLRLGGAIPVPEIIVAAALALSAGALAGRGRLHGTSQGARDNGSGVAAALSAAEHSGDSGTGVLITGSEEFGLVGARVFAQLEADRLRGSVVVNLDTIDQEGDLYLVSHDRRGEAFARELSGRLESLGVPVRSRRLPLGVLVDSMPLARAGIPAITVGRLTWRTLRRMHTPNDTPEDLSLDTALKLGRALATN